ncbi:MAG: hypothetical protein WCP85_27820 [Mariniphaga sp.]
MKAYIKSIVFDFVNSSNGSPYVLFKFLVCHFRSIYYTSKIDAGGGKISISSPFIRFKMDKHKSSRLLIVGNLLILPPVYGKRTVSITMDKNSTFEIHGDLHVGQGVSFILASDSKLSIGGQDEKSNSEMKSDSMVLVFNKIRIGKHFFSAHNVLITDSDMQHHNFKQHHSEIVIGNHVRIENSSSILKGTIIGENCILGSFLKIADTTFPDNVLIDGEPPQIQKNLTPLDQTNNPFIR